MSWAAAAAAVGTAVGSGVASYKGAKQAGKDQYKYSRKLRQTAYQDTMADMYRAGLNPILAYHKGPTPTTAQPQLNAYSGIAKGLSGAASAYQQYRQNEETRELTYEQKEKTFQQRRNEELTHSILRSQNKIMQHNASNAEMANDIARTYYKGNIKKAQIYSDSPNLQYIDRLMQTFSPMASSAKDVGATNYYMER